MKKNLIIWTVVFIALVSIGLVVSLKGAVNRNSSTVNNNQATSDSQVLVNDSSSNVENDNITTTSSEAPVSDTVQLANPASTNCIKLEGNLVTKTRGDGGEYSICYFTDDSACEEWALMRGDCQAGDVNNGEFDTIDQRYCAWAGGQTIIGPNSVCTFKDGSKCSTLDFFNGICPKT